MVCEEPTFTYTTSSPSIVQSGSGGDKDDDIFITNQRFLTMPYGWGWSIENSAKAVVHFLVILTPTTKKMAQLD